MQSHLEEPDMSEAAYDVWRSWKLSQHLIVLVYLWIREVLSGNHHANHMSHERCQQQVMEFAIAGLG